MTPSTLLIHDHDHIRTVTLNRPEARNAMTPQMQEELIAAFDCAVSDGIRVLILSGSGSAFCAGLDLRVLQSMHTVTAAEHAASAARIVRLFRTLWELPLPTIAVVDGPAMAGGAGLATLCDWTLATPAAKFAYTEARIGFVPAVVSAFLTLQLGDKRSRDLLLSARVFLAEEALAMGLVNSVVAAEELQPRLDALVATLLANSPESLAATKRLLAEQQRPWLDAALDAALAANAAARQMRDFREGIEAFLQKRKPQW